MAQQDCVRQIYLKKKTKCENVFLVGWIIASLISLALALRQILNIHNQLVENVQGVRT